MFVRPRISREEAEKILSAKKSFFHSGLKRTHAFLKKVELIHLPFYFFTVFVEKEGKKQEVSLSVDGLLGHAVLFVQHSLDVEEKGNHVVSDFELSESEAKKIVLNEYKGMLLEHGLRSRTFLKAGEISDGKKIYYPFWVGYFKKLRGYDFKAIDALSGEIQGIRMRKVFISAFRKIT